MAAAVAGVVVIVAALTSTSLTFAARVLPLLLLLLLRVFVAKRNGVGARIALRVCGVVVKVLLATSMCLLLLLFLYPFCHVKS